METTRYIRVSHTAVMSRGCEAHRGYFAFSNDRPGRNGNDFPAIKGQNESVPKPEIKQEMDFQSSMSSPLMAFSRPLGNGIQKYTAFIPNEETIQKYDVELNGFKKGKYVSKLLDLAKDREDSIIWYRSVLLSRALSIEGCPKEKLCVRRTTNRSTCNEKYAEDCYRLSKFLKGDTSPLDDMFTKSKAEDLERQKSVEIHEAVTKNTVQQLLVRVVCLEVALKQKEAYGKELEESIKILQENQKNLTARISKLESESSYKYTGISSEACEEMTNISPFIPNSPGKERADQAKPLTPVESMCIAYT